MSLPRPICPGTSYLVTRRCTQRQFLLLPSPRVNQVFQYCLGLAQKATGVQLHAAVVLSNHYHLIVTDPEGRLPEFVYTLNKYVAKCLNAHYGRWENLFAGGTQASYVQLGDDESLLAKSVYAICNPVAAGLVRRHRDWEGLCLWHPGTYKAKRPAVFFREEGPMPKAVKLRVEPIPLSGMQRAREVMETVGQAVAEREEELRAALREAGKPFLGLTRLRTQRPTDAPASREPRRGLFPRLAVRDKWRRIELLTRLVSFCDDYARALARYCRGERDVEFPAGTYKLKHQLGVRCADP